MRFRRPVVVVFVAALSLAVLSGAGLPGEAGVAAASHGPEKANYTVVPLDDRSPGATNVRYGQRVVAAAGVDLETLEKTTATYEEGSWSSCGPADGETFGIDRGETMDGYAVDEDLEDNVKSFTAGEDLFKVEYYGEDDFGASTYLNDGDEFISVAKCIDNPDEPGWYQISGTTTGVTGSGERVTFGSESHYFWICDCEDEAEAREELGPPPSEPTTEGTPTPEDGQTDESDEESGGEADSEKQSGAVESATATPTETGEGQATSASTNQPDATPTRTRNEADGGASRSTASDTATATPSPSEEWDDHVLQTPTASEGPGFGPVPALLALVCALLVVRRRT